MKLIAIFFSIIITGPVGLASTKNGFDANFYGFIKASANYSTEALGSFNNINLSAPTHASAQTRSQDSVSRMSFQTQHTRFGTHLKKNNNLSARLEFDFIDFNKSSPTTHMVPRVRIASVTYAWENQKVIIGQDWDLFSPVTAHTFDYVGLYFLAGNTGFMRSQAQYLIDFNDWELAGALGMAGSNPGMSDDDLELGKSPSYALRLTRRLSRGKVGVSGIYARLYFDHTSGSEVSSSESYAGNLFYEINVKELNIKSEAYYSQNIANIGALGLGRGVGGRDVKEFGGTLTMSYEYHEKQTVFGGAGMAKVVTPQGVTPFELGPDVKIISPGILENIIMRLGWAYKVTPDLSWTSELSRYETTSKISSNQNQTNHVYGLESGIQLRF